MGTKAEPSALIKSRRRNIRRHGIYLIEADWWGRLDRKASVEPVLQLLNQWDPHYVPYVRRDVATREELGYYLKQWSGRANRKFPILYIGTHGEGDVLTFGDRRNNANKLTLEELGESLAGRCRGRIIYLGGCGLMSRHGNTVRAFLRQTEALALCGWKTDIDWLQGAAVEVLIFGVMQRFAMDRRGAAAMSRHIFDESGGLAKKLGFAMRVRDEA